nr:hypothetical protein [Tanacetum cinerariifolium]
MNKKDENGVVVRNKARLVAQGHKQKEGIDYNEVFAHMEMIEAIRIFLAFASYMGFIVYQMDVKSAFMYDTIDEELYVTQPPRFVNPKFPNKVITPRAWYTTLSTLLERSGYRRGAIDKTLFIKQDKKDIMLVQVYVDDIIFGSTKKSWCDEFEKLMKNRFQMSYMGELTFFLRLQVKQKEDGIFISQDKSMIGSLVYLTASRPDIMFAVCACSRFQVTPKTSYLQAMKRIFRYLKGQPKLGLWYPKASSFDLEAYSDSDYAGANLDRKSTTGDTKIYIDNESTICIVKNPIFHSKTKHIEIRYHFIRDAYEKKLIQVLKIHIDDNVVDLLTKAFDVSSNEALAIPEQTAAGVNTPRYDEDSLEVKELMVLFVQFVLRKMELELLLFWSTAKVKTVNDEVRVQVLIDGKRVNIKESSIRHTLKLDVEEESWYLFYGVITPMFENMLIPAAEEQLKAPKVPSPEPSPEHQLPSPFNDPIPDADKDSLKFQELMDLCTRLSNKVLDLEKEENRVLKEKSFKTTQVDTDAPVENMDKSFKQGRMIADMDEDIEDTDEEEPAEVEEVLKVVTVVKLITEVVTTVAPTGTAAQVSKASAPMRRRGVVIQDPKETAASVIVHSEVQTKDKGKGILIQKPKPLKGQAQIDMDEAFARHLEAKLNANINWNDVIEQVKRSERQDNTVIRYQALKRKPVTEAQARKNMMIYLKNMAGFKMDFFKGMTYSKIRHIFEKHYNSIQAFLEKVEKEVTIQEEGNKRQGKSLEQDIAKKQRMDKEEEELKRHLQIVANDDDDVYTEATHLASKVPVVGYQIHHENNKPYYKIIRADGTHKLFLSFITLLKNFDKEDLEALWKLVKERFETTKPNNFSDDFMFEKPNIEASVWKN